MALNRGVEQVSALYASRLQLQRSALGWWTDTVHGADNSGNRHPWEDDQMHDLRGVRELCPEGAQVLGASSMPTLMDLSYTDGKGER